MAADWLKKDFKETIESLLLHKKYATNDQPSARNAGQL
jgi:hypothetical protein